MTTGGLAMVETTVSDKPINEIGGNRTSLPRSRDRVSKRLPRPHGTRDTYRPGADWKTVYRRINAGEMFASASDMNPAPTSGFC